MAENALDLQTLDLDKLTKQLYNLPAIIGRLGLSIAGAQKAFNADYVAQIARLVALAQQIEKLKEKKTTQPKPGQNAVDSVLQILQQLAPPRYQFTETTIDFSADLSQAMALGVSASLGINTSAVVVNAGMTLGYGYDYRAAARVTSTIHARPVGPDFAKELIDRAGKVSDRSLTLPAAKEVDKAMENGLKVLTDFLAGTKSDADAEEEKRSASDLQ